MSKLLERDRCTGCMACFQVCPKSCLTIKKDNMGNLFPEIDDGICVQCNKCEKVCPEKHLLQKQYPRKAYAVWSLDSQTRKLAASGGAASEFYRYAVNNGWWICGTEWTDEFQVSHTLSKKANSISKYRQSKYVYSSSSEIYRQVEKKLKGGEKVLFISLPCKVAGMLQYLDGRHENLITIDIVCHGTPSHQLLREHIKDKFNVEIATALSFRQDNEFVFSLKNSQKDIYTKVGRTDSYLAAFLEGLDYRPSCYQCTYASNERISDLTICDFWGLGQKIPFKHPYTGAISAVLVNTDKGAEFFEKCKTAFFVEERPVAEALEGNAQLNHPTTPHPKREMFEKLYLEKGFDKAVEEILKYKMHEEKKKLRKQELRRKLREISGIFIKKYRR